MNGNWAAVMMAAACVGCAGKKAAGPLISPQERSRALYEVDRQFARLAAEQGPARAFQQYADAQSLRLNPTGPNTVGRDALAAELRSVPPGGLTWIPRFAEAAVSGELGWTWGDYLARGPQGERRGRYVTVWRLTPAGWRIAGDIGTSAP